jgi:hypothetical protein
VKPVLPSSVVVSEAGPATIVYRDATLGACAEHGTATRAISDRETIAEPRIQPRKKRNPGDFDGCRSSIDLSGKAAVKSAALPI